MSQHLIAWQQSVDSATLVAINTVSDDILTRSGATRFLVPADYNFVHWGYAAGADITRAVLNAPSLQVRRMFPEIIPSNRVSEVQVLTSPSLWRPTVPIELVPSEELEAQIAEDNAAASQNDVFVALGPAELPPIPSGDIRINRCLGTTTLTARAWSTVTVTPDLAMEPGEYTLIGFIVNGATVVAARALFRNQAYRPGVLGLPGADADARDFNAAMLWPYGGYAMGQFNHLEIPQFQFWATAADTTQRVYMISVKTG